AIPLIIYWLFWTFNTSYWFNADPAAVYFLDSLSIFAGKSYVYVDHPGTPVQLIGSFLLALTYPFFGSLEAFISFHLARPGAFFLMANLFLLVANILCAFAIFKTAITTLRHDRILGGVAISLLFFTLHPYSFPSLTLWSHNSFNFPFGTLWLIGLYLELRRDEALSPRRLVMLGFAAGILSMAQMYFLAWLVSGIFTVFIFSLRLRQTFRKSLESSMYMLAGGVLGILAMLAPIYKELPRFMAWLTRIITYQGLYGSGEKGIYSLSFIPLSINFWWDNIRPMIIVLLVTLVILGFILHWKRRTGEKIEPSVFAMISGLLLQIGLILLLMSKAALKLRYSLSLAAILPVLILLVLKLLETTPWKTFQLKRVFYGMVLVGVVISLISQINLQAQRSFVEQDAAIAKMQAVRRLAKEKRIAEENVIVVYAYAVPLKCAGLLQASNWIGSFKKEIAVVCPNQHAIWDSNIELNISEYATDIKDLTWDLVIWPGNGTNLPDYLYSVGAINMPQSWHIRRSSWFFIHPTGK
ncbi:MAG: hypothetical protein ABIU06_06145, partial [Anaerolineales bacterium]